jgi:hypothetical protein
MPGSTQVANRQVRHNGKLARRPHRAPPPSTSGPFPSADVALGRNGYRPVRVLLMTLIR